MSEFIKSLEAFSNESKNGEILVFYGVGGIGKTKLIRKLYEETDQILLKSEHKTTINKVHISLDAYDYSNPVNVLMNIRKQLSISCPLFDYALLAYSVKTKQNAEDVSRRFSGLKGPVFDIINELISLGMGSVSIPSNILRKAADLVSDIHIKMKFKEEVEAINGYTESEIYQRLPYYLGISINHAAEKGTRHVIFIDSYESLLLRVKAERHTKSHESAHGVPLYLDMCVDLYENALNNNMVLDTAMFSIPTNKIINRYIRHLKANEKNAIRLLSVLDFFSNELALFILVRENLFLSEDELDNLFEKSIFVLLDEHQYFYKIDESVRHHL